MCEQWNASKINSAIHQKKFTPRSGETYLRNKNGFKTCTSTNVIHYTKTMKYKNHIILSSDADKNIWQSSTSIYNNKNEKNKIDKNGNCLNMTKTNCEVVFLSLNHVQLFATPWTASHRPSLSLTMSQSLLKLMSVEPVMPSNHFIFCSSLLLLPSNFPRVRVFFSQQVVFS